MPVANLADNACAPQARGRAVNRKPPKVGQRRWSTTLTWVAAMSWTALALSSADIDDGLRRRRRKCDGAMTRRQRHADAHANGGWCAGVTASRLAICMPTRTVRGACCKRWHRRAGSGTGEHSGKCRVAGTRRQAPAVWDRRPTAGSSSAGLPTIAAWPAAGRPPVARLRDHAAVLLLVSHQPAWPSRAERQSHDAVHQAGQAYQRLLEVWLSRCGGATVPSTRHGMHTDAA